MAASPEAGQVLYAAGSGWYAMDGAADALLAQVVQSMAVAYANRFQRLWAKYGEIGDAGDVDPGIAGITYRPFRYPDYDLFDTLTAEQWAAEAPNREECAKPNLEHAGVAIWWYKHPGRGTSCNRDMTPNDWFEWFHSAMTAIDKYERDTFANVTARR